MHTAHYKTDHGRVLLQNDAAMHPRKITKHDEKHGLCVVRHAGVVQKTITTLFATCNGGSVTYLQSSAHACDATTSVSYFAVCSMATMGCDTQKRKDPMHMKQTRRLSLCLLAILP